MAGMRWPKPAARMSICEELAGGTPQGMRLDNDAAG
jgi:hypothetical protein